MVDEELDYEEIETTPVQLNNLQIYQQDKALIDMQISTAKHYPRDLKKAISNAITLVSMDKSIAEKCTYTIRKGGKAIIGPSVNLAKILVQQMGNMRIEQRVVGYDDKHVTCEGTCFDLERNLAIRTQIKKSIYGNNGRFSEDMCVITGNAGNAIALRNAIFAVISMDLVELVHKAARDKITGDISDENKLVARRTTVFEGFKQNYAAYKLTDEEIAASVGKSSISNIDADDILVLIGYEKSLKDGEATVDSIFRPTDTAMKVKTKPADKSAERIIQLIESCKTKAALEKLFKDCTTTEAKAAYDAKFKTLK